MSAEIHRLRRETRLDYLDRIASRNGINYSDEDEIADWALSIFRGGDFLRYYDAAELVLNRRIRKRELKRIDFILTHPNLTPEERLERLQKRADLF